MFEDPEALKAFVRYAVRETRERKVIEEHSPELSAEMRRKDIYCKFLLLLDKLRAHDAA